MLGLAESAGENDPAGPDIATEIPIVRIEDSDWIREACDEARSGKGKNREDQNESSTTERRKASSSGRHTRASTFPADAEWPTHVVPTHLVPIHLLATSAHP
jgi:hypothetical protein